MSGRYIADPPERAAATRFLRHTVLSALLATVLSLLFARQSLVSQGEPVLPWDELLGMLAVTILFFVLPVYAACARIGYAFLKNTRNNNHRYASCVVYGVLVAVSLCMSYLLVSLFQEGMYSLLFIVYSLFYLFVAAGIGAAAGAIVGRALGFEGDIRIGPPL